MAGTLRDPGSDAPPTPPPPPSAAPPLAQYLSLDPLAWVDPKHSRHGELRRALQGDDRPQELRRIRATVADSSSKAREKARSMQEAVDKVDRCRNVLNRKRQRCDPAAAGAEKLGTASSGALRIGAQNNSSNKRVRSSLADGRLEGRNNISTRQSPLVNNEKSSPVEKEKGCGRTSGLSEDKLRGLSTGGEGWEKKLKRKRSIGTVLNRGNDADRDVKSGGQHRPANEANARPSDSLAHRHGASAIEFAGSRMDGSSQQNSNSSRILCKTDVDYATPPNERRERHAGIEKERAMVKGNKAHASEDIQTGNISPFPKAKACRAPRTGSHVMASASSFQRSAGGSDELEEAPCSNKASLLGDMTNRKRSTHSSASSPPIAWVGQRPQKMSRTRRANVVSPVSNFDEVLSDGSPLDTAIAAKPSSVESCGVMLTKDGTSSHTQTANKMDDSFSPVGLSGSEGSAVTEGKVKEKATNSDEVENEAENIVRNSAGLIVSSNKNMIPLKEELQDGSVRRQGRSCRGTMHVKGYSSISKEKLDAAETRKPLKGGRPGSEKNESKVECPPMRKGSDRKDSSCFPQSLNCEQADDQEELLAAVNAARGAIVGAYCGPFWKKMEPMLTFISSENLSFLKNQIDIVEELDLGMSYMPGGEYVLASTNYSRQKMDFSCGELVPSNSSILSEQNETNGVGLKGTIDKFYPSEENRHHVPQKMEADKWLHEMVPMENRLLSAIIMEDDFSEPNVLQRDILVEFSNSHVPYAASRFLRNELQASAISSNFGLSVDFMNSNNTSVVHRSMRNGFTNSSSFISSSSQSSVHTDNLSDGVNFVYPEDGSFHNLIPQISSQCRNPGKKFSSSPHEYQYGQLSVNDKIFIELQSIGVCPETVPKLDDGEDENINKMISELRKRLHDQVKQKKCKLSKLDKAIQDTKSIEERSLEQHAVNKLVERAYQKLKGGRTGSSYKAGASKSTSKAAKQLALDFAKRTLMRCHKFEESKKSCFSEPSLWSVLSAPLPSSITKSTEGVERLKHQKQDRSPLDQGGIKWKKSHKEREHIRDASAKGSGTRSGRHSSGSGRSGERKNKTKPKQKIVQLSTSGNVVGRVVESVPTPARQEATGPSAPLGTKVTQQPRNPPENAALRLPEAPLANLPGIYDIFAGTEGLDEQGNDISSWLTDDLDVPQDFDLSGALEIPLDDITELGFM
ncbi:uncharacterized protein LOC102708898 [Oryza brachyantha]|nr:uncharacterized protein LOC102708898 [Oryza brachyantha]